MKISPFDEESKVVNDSSNSENDDKLISLNPEESHVFGGDLLTISFNGNETVFADDSQFYVVFKGSNIYHITSSKVHSSTTLQAVIPYHDSAEAVKVSVHYLKSSEDKATEILNKQFTFFADNAYLIAKELIENISNADAICKIQTTHAKELKNLGRDKKILDSRLVDSLMKLSFPTSWGIDEASTNQWTLLHFCAKYRLPLMAEYLLTKTGATKVLKITDSKGRTPLDIACKIKHTKLIEIFSRKPCEADSIDKVEFNISRPVIKRHKLGTITITNKIPENKDIDIDKGLMLLKELDLLSANANEHLQKFNDSDDRSPLAESLMKLQEINAEIRRLSSLSYKEIVEESGEGVISDSDEDVHNSGVFDNASSPTDHSRMLRQNEDIGASNHLPSQRRLSNVLVGVIEQPDITEVAEVVPTLFEEIEVFPCPVEEVTNKNVSTEDATNKNLKTEELSDVESITKSNEIMPSEKVLVSDSDSLSSGSCENLYEVKSEEDVNNLQEMNFKQLESVLEETEEDLNEDTTLQRRNRNHMHSSVDDSNTSAEILHQLPKRVAVLRKHGEMKHERPLSDSFENLRMVEREGLLELYSQNSNLDKKENVTRVLSLDQLINKSNTDDLNEHHSHTSLNKESQNSLNFNANGSESSLASDAELQTYRQRSDSSKSASVVGSFLSTSSYSLNDAHMYGASSNQGNDSNIKFAKKPSLLSKMSFKKAKSMTSLVDDKDNSYVVEANKHAYDFSKANKTSSFISNDKDLKKSQSSVSVNAIIKEPVKIKESRRVSTTDIPSSSIRLKLMSEEDDEDTDEATSVSIVNRFAHERKSSDEKIKKRFGIIPTNKKNEKDKKAQKDKEKEKEKEKEKKNKQANRKDSDPKTKVLKLPLKSEIPISKTDTKSSSSFLTKRGNSFRNNQKAVTIDSKTNAENHKAMFIRNIGNSKDGTNKLRSSDRKSPVIQQKSSSVESEVDVNIESSSEVPCILLDQSQNLSNSKSSLESLSNIADDTDYNTPTCQENAYDSDLDAKDEPETWSELVDKKVQRKMQAKDIKRQDVIYELIQTEAVYVRVLYIMRKIYAHGMTEVLGMDHAVVDSIFPRLNELIELNGSFLNKLKERQQSSPNYCIEHIGDILVDLFGGENGEMLKNTYGYFCSHHSEALSTYKEILKNDRQFAGYMRSCMLNKRTRRLSVPECITYVTIRITKYPLLIEAIMKATKESKPGYDTLKTALNLVKEFLVAVDDSVESYEQQKVLDVLKKSIDKRSVVEIKSSANNVKSIYKATKLFTKRSRLMHDKKCLLKGKSKNYETRMVVLADKLIFLTDNGGKFQLLSVDNKPPVLLLKSVMVREVATDNKALFLVSNGKDGAQMYEVVCDSYKDKKEFMPKLQSYIRDCPDEGDNTTDEEENKKEEAERMEKLKEIAEQLQMAEEKVVKIFTEKNKLVNDMRELLENMDESGLIKGPPCTSIKRADIENARETLENCLSEVNALASIICSYSVDLTITSPSPSPINNTASITSGNHAASITRADTFNATEQRTKPPSISNNVNRISSMKPINRSITSMVEESKPRRQSQLLSALGRGAKMMGSTEDLTSVASSASMSSLSTVTSALSQVTLFQSLKDHLSSLVEVTNRQDLEVAKMRLDLQEARLENVKLVEERKQLEEKLIQQQKDSDRQLRNENEKYLKLTREFKRNNDRLNKQIDEKKIQYQQLLEAYNALNKQLGSELSNNADDSTNHKRQNSEEVLYF